MDSNREDFSSFQHLRNPKIVFVPVENFEEVSITDKLIEFSFVRRFHRESNELTIEQNRDEDL